MAHPSLSAFALVLSVATVLAAPAVAYAAGYVADDHVTVAGPVRAGEAVDVAFAPGSFTGSEKVSFSVTGSGVAVLATVKADTVSIAKTANAAGATSVTVTLPADATGSYLLTATGLSSGTVGTATLTPATADAAASSATGTDLANTGFNAPILLIWLAAGALLLGLVLVLMVIVLRHRRARD